MIETVTPINNPQLWYSYYRLIQKDAPEILDYFIENTASDLELPVDYFIAEFL